MTAQQLFRVRDTTDKNIYLCVREFGNRRHPTKYKDIDIFLTKYINLENKIIDNEIKKCINNEINGLLKIDIIKREFKKDAYYKLLVNYIKKINESRNYFRTELLLYLVVQGYYLRENDKSKINEEFKEEHKQIFMEYKQLRNKEEVKLFRNIKCPTCDELNKINLKSRKTKEDRVKIQLYEMKQQGINMDDKDDAQVLNIINNIYNSRFDYIIKKEKVPTAWPLV
eukprot:TRINITY_DN24_c0_g2_i3.p1 TRINITY_DN24_c0_g2~~TRINITY_DN24_c0_g2_i3.p1  ORF type:complete len:226 (-),score=38.60 TRINITY_DN24_c0_g2_i3:28-705(-)